MRDLDYGESNPQRWYKAQSYYWQSDRLSSKGAFSEYDPFKTPRELYEDFHSLMRKVEAYRTAFSTLGIAYAKRSKRSGYISRCFQDEKNGIMEQYAGFACRWGLLGCGFSRIIDVSNPECRTGNAGSAGSAGNGRDIIHEQGNVKKLILREANASFDLILPAQGKAKSLRFDRFKAIYPDNLPTSGGSVPLSVWQKDYSSTNFRSYSESIHALTGCRELLSILKDVNHPEINSKTTHHPAAVEMTDGITLWSFGSLIQAIAMIYALNKSGQLTNPWGICHECGRMFSLRNKHSRKYCSDTCNNRVKQRNFRAKRK